MSEIQYKVGKQYKVTEQFKQDHSEAYGLPDNDVFICHGIDDEVVACSQDVTLFGMPLEDGEGWPIGSIDDLIDGTIEEYDNES